jgi:hypothetical protein
MRQDDDAGQAVNCLQRERPLLLHLAASVLAAVDEQRMPVFSLLEVPGCTLHSTLGLVLPATDGRVLFGNQFGEGHLDVCGHALNLGGAICPNFFQERQE